MMSTQRMTAHLGRDTRRFLAAALRAPREIGAIAPSGRRLAACAAALMSPGQGQTVIELGPGGGVITDALYQRLTGADHLLAVERNQTMAAHLTATRPWLKVVNGDAADLPALLAKAGHSRADIIVSALPWSVIPDADQHALLNSITSILNPGGTFATVLTLPLLPLPIIRQLRRRLSGTFATVTHLTVWRNVPPARLYVCTAPTSPDMPQPVATVGG
jgi:phosphatidylethanolamine/phosphatidyl-N-methylethanolamine N-methyltransferase